MRAEPDGEPPKGGTPNDCARGAGSSVRVVFPALRERLEKCRVHLIDIDLRWGGTKEQADNDRVLDVCS
jgi:hypothetical protein